MLFLFLSSSLKKKKFLPLSVYIVFYIYEVFFFFFSIRAQGQCSIVIVDYNIMCVPVSLLTYLKHKRLVPWNRNDLYFFPSSDLEVTKVMTWELLTQTFKQIFHQNHQTRTLLSPSTDKMVKLGTSTSPGHLCSSLNPEKKTHLLRFSISPFHSSFFPWSLGLL